MYKIDNSVLDTEGKILFNISEQLSELISLLKPQEIKLYKCKKCGKEFDSSPKVAIHTKNCKE